MSGIVVDRTSLLVSAPGSARLATVEEEAAKVGLTLGLPTLAAEGEPWMVTTWIARGLPGAPVVFADPADHVVAGFVVTIGGRRLEVRPAPRRAVGPDLFALVAGANRRFAEVEQAWLRLHVRGARRVAFPLAGSLDLDPPVSPGEAALLDAIARELGPSA